MNHIRFNNGDVVVHSSRPEWGYGIIKDVQETNYNGSPAQRLSIDFANRGRIVINTAVAKIRHKNIQWKETMSYSTSSINADGGWLAALEKSGTVEEKHELWDLPDQMLDPFNSPLVRLKATIDSYRFSLEPRSLIDWAVAQTQMKDPLAKYTRHELEQAFLRFARNREQYLFNLVKQIKREGDLNLILDILEKSTYPEASIALEKAMRS